MNMSVKNARSIQSVTITDCMLSLEEFIAVAKYGAKVEFAPEMIETVNANRKLLDKFLKEGRIIYGVTTGFGENVRYTISPEDANTLQENIVRTHSVAVGEPLDREQARAVMLMSILNDGKGHSGIRIETLDLIRQMLNLESIPGRRGRAPSVTSAWRATSLWRTSARARFTTTASFCPRPKCSQNMALPRSSSPIKRAFPCSTVPSP